jgi:hypothetical protein
LKLTKISLKSKQNKKNIQPLILEASVFTSATKKNVVFVIYATPMGTSTEKGV